MALAMLKRMVWNAPRHETLHTRVVSLSLVTDVDFFAQKAI